MPVLAILSLSALRYAASGAMKAAGLSDDAADGLVENAGGIATELVRYFTDHSSKLTNALSNANERSWRTLELSLAGNTFWDRCKAALSRGEDQALAQQVRGFLDRAILAGLPGRGQDFRVSCLEELRAARRVGALSGGSLDRDALQREAGSFARYANPLALVDAEWRAVEQIADELHQAGYTRLSQLLRLRPDQHLPLLVIAARYYFRRAVEQDSELSNGLTFAKLEALAGSQEQGFQQVADLLERQGTRLEELLADVQAKVVDTHGGVKRIEQHMIALQQQFSELTARLGLRGDQQVRSSDTRTIRNEEERRLVTELLAEYRAIPEGQRRQRPALLSAVARLENAAGDHAQALEDYRLVANLATDDKPRQAEAHFNAYRAALERAGVSKKKEDWDAALMELIKAFNRDRKYMPFDRKYQPQRILGAGGFGVTFLCKRRGPGDLVAVKSLTSENLDRDTEKVLDEGRTLGSLDHSAIIRMIDCDYADPETKSGPFLVMEYFDGQTLEELVSPTSLVPVGEAVTLFRLVAEGMGAAHAKGVWHRDIKPANLLARREPTGWRAKIIDFGLALRRELTQTAMSASTSRQGKTLMGGSIAGTLHYAAPEQMDAERQKEVGPWSDVYGFGKTCYYALFGSPTPDDDDKDRLPEGLKRLLSRCTSQAVGKRPQSFTEVVQQLKEIEGALIPTAVAIEPVGELEVVEEKQWYYSQAGRQTGPVPEATLRNLVQSGQVRGTDLVWRHGFKEWVPVESVKKWGELLPQPAGATAMPATVAPAKPGPTAPLTDVALRITGDVRRSPYSAQRSFLGRMITTPTKFKFYLDDRFVGEGDDHAGVDLRLRSKAGNHILAIKELDSLVSKDFPVSFPVGGRYEIRVDGLEKGKLPLIDVDVIHHP